MNLNNLELSIIQVYAPTEASSDEELEFFYSTVDKAIKLSDNNIIVMGDFNAKIGQTNPTKPLPATMDTETETVEEDSLILRTRIICIS